MTRHHKQKSAGKQLRSLYLWHRWIGMTAAVFVVLLSLTGLALNHTERMGLDSRHVAFAPLLDWYGINAPDDITVYVAGSLTVASLGRQVYIGTAPLPGAEAPVSGAVLLDDFIVVGLKDQLLLLTRDGELVERLDATAGIPAGVQALGTNASGRLVVAGADGDYSADSDLSRWQRSNVSNVTWSTPVTPAPALVTALQQHYRGSGLTVERVMLDLHSGRILGAWGVYLMDAAAIVFLLLAASGIWLWGKRRASARAHRKRIHRHYKTGSGDSGPPQLAPGKQQAQQAQQ